MRFHYPTRFGVSALLRLLRNTEIKGISAQFAYRSLLIRRREAKETKKNGGKGKVEELKEGSRTMQSFD